MIYIIGVGMGHDETVTLEGKKIIDKCKIIIGSERITKKYKDIKKVFVSYKVDEIKEFLKGKDEDTAILVSGDVSFYSGGIKIAEGLKGYDFKIVSGISSAAYFCGKLNIDMGNIKTVSLHGKECNITGYIRRYKNVFSLLGSGDDLKTICDKLCLYGMGDVIINVGEKLSYKDERIIRGKAADLRNTNLDKLSVILTENKNYCNDINISIDDDEFIRGNVPMTKSEIREISISKMKLKNNSVIYDIGAGTGSVSVECALRAIDGKVYAIEKNSEAIELIEKNKIKFGADNIEIVKGSAADAIKKLPAADCAFIGGSGGEIEEIIKELKIKNKNIRIVINAVSLNTLGKITNLIEKNGFNADIVQIQSSKAKKIGSHYMMMGQNPIYIITIDLYNNLSDSD